MWILLQNINYREELTMTICPIALVAGCKKCLAFKICPLKSVIGDYKKPDETQTKQHEESVQNDIRKDQ